MEGNSEGTIFSAAKLAYKRIGEIWRFTMDDTEI
jgi:hypothetical protein